VQAEWAIRDILVNTVAVTAIVGSGSAAKIYMGRRVQTTAVSAVSIEAAGIEPTDQKPDSTGSGQGISRLDVEDILVFSYGSSYESANTLAVAVRAAVDKKIAGTYNSVVVQSIQFMSEDYFNENTDPATHVFEHRYRVRVIR
jgi:hypothetical protein